MLRKLEEAEISMRYNHNPTSLSAMNCLALLLAMPVIANATDAANPEKNLVAEAPKPPEAPEAIEKNFRKADADKDGSLSPAEAKGTGFFRGESFDETDQDENGYVTLFELARALTQSTQKWMSEHDEHDENDDGHVDRQEAEYGTRIYTVFDRADKDKDNRLNSQEMKDWAASSYYSESASYPLVPNIVDKKF